MCRIFFFFPHPATTDIYTLSLHDALPISPCRNSRPARRSRFAGSGHSSVLERWGRTCKSGPRSEEHTSELQSHVNIVCRLLLEKKKIRTNWDTDDRWLRGNVTLPYKEYYG